MATPVYQAQNNNKCPHGFPIGACPICSGMSGGGASKDKNKPRVAGEMSYNECMAEWMRMQRAKDEKIQAEIDKLHQLRLSDIKDKINAQIARLQQKIDKYLEKLDNLASKLPPIAKEIVKSVLIPVVNFSMNVAKQILVVVFNISNFISSVSEKLASFYGEIKNFVKDAIKTATDRMKKTIKIVLSLFLESSDTEDDDKQKIKKLLEKLFKIHKKEHTDHREEVEHESV